MIYLYQNNREYDYDVRAIALAFFEREKIIETTKEEFDAHVSNQNTKIKRNEEEKASPELNDQKKLWSSKEKESQKESKELQQSKIRFLELIYGKEHIKGRFFDLDGTVSEDTVRCRYFDHAHCRNQVCRFLYRLFCGYTGRTLPWGMLTGIRPTKIIMKWMDCLLYTSPSPRDCS